jgi:hypothetical protein
MAFWQLPNFDGWGDELVGTSLKRRFETIKFTFNPGSVWLSVGREGSRLPGVDIAGMDPYCLELFSFLYRTERILLNEKCQCAWFVVAK